jgi:multiple sugar transport system permease protein
MITPVIFFNVVLGVIGSFQIFTTAFIATGGGPVNATLFYVLWIYRHAFENFRMGYAATLAWVLLAIILIFTLIQFYLARKWVYYEGGSN